LGASVFVLFTKHSGDETKENYTVLEGKKENAYSVLMGKYGGKKLPEKICLIWENNIKIDFK
jgi:hypothetical protein